MSAAPLSSPEIARRVTGLLEVDADLPRGAFSAPGRGQKGAIFGRYLAAYILVTQFDLPVEQVANLLNRDRGTVTKALKIFRFLEGYQGWRIAMETLADLARKFIDYGAQRAGAAEQIPAPVGREGRNDPLAAWVRDRYAVEIEAQGEIETAAEARALAEADSIYLRHPAVMAILNDVDLVRTIGEPVVSVTISPPDDVCVLGRPILLAPPEERQDGALTLRLLVKGDSPSQIKTMLDARASVSRALLRQGWRLSGVAETYPARDREGWRYIPLRITKARAA